LSFGAWQLVGLVALVLVPVLAMFKAFGDGEASVAGQAGPLRIAVDFPPRVTNTGGSTLDTVRVLFDSSYVVRVLEPRFLPAASRAFEVDLADVAPGESRRVELSFYADDYGRSRGAVAAHHAGDSARVMIATFVFP